jgi:glycosyltransferase involved in cell wall biosynthesis
MYQNIPAVRNKFVEPWLLPLDCRQQMLTNGRLKIAYFYERPNDSSFRYRSFNMCEAINTESRHSSLSGSFFFANDFIIFEWLASTADLLVVCRSGITEILLRLITLFKDKAKVVIFDTDDLIFDPGFSMQLALASGQDPSDAQTLDYWHAYTSRMRETAILCDCITTTNSYLATIATQSLGIQSRVITNSLNQGQILASEETFELKSANSFSRNSRFTIGYFSGSPSHKNDFALIAKALARLLEMRSFVDIIVAGYIELGIPLSRFSDRVTYEPFRDYISLQRLIATCELCVAPLEYNTFTNCKSELKYFESAAVGTACIASPTFAFKQAISNDVNGYLSRSHEWLPILISAADNPGRIAQISKNAFKSATTRYSPRAIFRQIMTAYDLRHTLMS